MLLILLMRWCCWYADSLILLMHWCCWCCWCGDIVDALMLLMLRMLRMRCCWCADALMRWCCSCADVADMMMLLMCQCWCVSSHTLQCTGADALMTMVWLQNNSVILKEILKVAKSQRFQWFVRFWKIFLQQGYEVTEVTGLRRAKRFCHFQRNSKGCEVTKVSMIC